MPSSGRGTTLGIDGSRFGPVLPHGGSGNLQVTCVSEFWFSSLEAGLIVRGVVGMMGGGVYASVCTVPRVHWMSWKGMFFPLAPVLHVRADLGGRGTEPGHRFPTQLTFHLLAGFPPWSGPVSQYLIPPHALYLWKGATGSSQEVLINAATGISCQGLDPVSTPFPLRWLWYRLSSRFQRRNPAH